MRIFGSEKLDSVLQTLGLEKDECIKHPWITKALERAQKKVEARNFEIRKSLLKFDDVMNEQRKIIYEQRREIINGDDVDQLVFDMRHDYIDEFIDQVAVNIEELDDTKKKLITETFKNNLNTEVDFKKLNQKSSLQIDDIKQEIRNLSDNNINLKKTKYPKELFDLAQKSLLLQIIDQTWKEHLLSLDHLRQCISLRAYGQRDPLNEYKQEAFNMFEEMMKQIRQNVSKLLSFVEIKTEVPQPDSPKPNLQSSEDHEKKCLEDSDIKKISRNARCPRTGKKYKNCCGSI